MNKATWLHWAELVDSYRLFPRAVLIAYGAFVYHVTDFVLKWYAAEPAVARGAEETAMVGVVFTAVTGFAGWVFKVYSDNGRDWNQAQKDPP
jgi:hypothetical protein